MSEADTEQLVVPYPLDEDARANVARFLEALPMYGWKGWFDLDRDAFVFKRPQQRDVLIPQPAPHPSAPILNP